MNKPKVAKEDQMAEELKSSMANKSNSERLRGFDDGQTDRRLRF